MIGKLNLEKYNVIQSREDELSLLVESLRSKIRDINVNLSDRESDMKREIVELHEQLKKLNPAVIPNGNAKKKPAVPQRQFSNDVKSTPEMDKVTIFYCNNSQFTVMSYLIGQFFNSSNCVQSFPRSSFLRNRLAFYTISPSER